MGTTGLDPGCTEKETAFKDIIETDGKIWIWIVILYQCNQHSTNTAASIQYYYINVKSPELDIVFDYVVRKYKLKYLKINYQIV